ncbi:Multidrug ABC transporter ATP-binding protein OS=Lysinibacillus sphaericus OX=1421 GN=LS41612_10280 PE=4 SV=1 [Lysinibacillus sphaericus]
MESVQRAFMMTLRIFVRGPLLFIGAVIIVFVTARELFSILLVIVPILIMAMYFFTKYSGVLYRKVQEAIDGVNTKLQENLAGIRVVKAFRREKHQVEQFAMLNDTLTKRFITAEQIVGILVPFTMFVVNIGIVAALWLGAIKVETGTLQVGVILAFINYLTIILNGLMSSSMVLMQIARALPSGERIVDVLNREVAVTEVAQPIKTSIQGMIDFQNVSYRYYENSEDVLKNITFSVQVGQTIGIIGKTGSGKSTLVKLLPRLVDPTSGVILLDGKPLHQYALPTLRKHIGFTSQKALLFSGTIEKNIRFGKIRKRVGVVLQDTYLFTGTIRENIRFGKLDATDAEVEEAAKIANAHNFIKYLPAQYDTVVQAGGANLSQGQRQLLAIARAILENADILILDEATSSVDTQTEVDIQKGLQHLMQGRTSFVIAHRLKTIENANQIFVIQQGEIVEQGNHQQLMQQQGIYNNLQQKLLLEQEQSSV